MTNVNFLKHAEKMIKGISMSRPVLKNLNVSKGRTVVTDSHRLYSLATPNAVEGTFTLSGQAYTDGNYPDTSRLMPDLDDAKCAFRVNVKEMYEFSSKITPLHKLMNAPQGHLTLEFDLAARTFQVPGRDNHNFQASIPLGDVATCDYDQFKVNVQGTFLKEAFDLIKSLGYADATIYFYDAKRPIVIEAGDIQVLLLPVRIY